MVPRPHEGLFDVLVIGAGPAGATAAICLAREGKSVCLIDQAHFPRLRDYSGWLSASADTLLADLGVSAELLDAHAFHRMAFYTADLTKVARPNLQHSPGYLVDRAVFDHELVKVAVREGAHLVEGYAVERVDLQEQSVTLSVPGRPDYRGRLLVLAAGRATPLLHQLAMACEAPSGGSWLAQIGTDRDTDWPDPSVSVVLGVDQVGGFGTIVNAGRFVCLNVQSPGPRSDIIPNLVTLCRNAARAKIVDVDLSKEASAAEILVHPTAVALSMDTHVAKRSLIIGDAGGFVSAASGEGIFPAMWSARIAAGVLLNALDATNTQDALMEFNSVWRTTMADYLRSPNTDTQYILPLIFSNQPMADRMAAAFFHGENI